MPEKFKPYIDKKGKEVDFESKRLKFWLETVPSDVRRVEYALWKRYRIFHHLNLYQFEQKRDIGRFAFRPPYTSEQEEIDWKDFSHSFLIGEDRKKRFNEIIYQTEMDLPKIFEAFGDRFPKEHIDIVALTGSTAYGPRKPEARFSDTDLRFLFDVPNDSMNVEVMPDLALKELGTPYHLIGTGTTDAARGPHADIHWLLYPHYPLQNRLDDARLKEIIARLVNETRSNSDILKSRIAELEKLISKKREGLIIG